MVYVEAVRDLYEASTNDLEFDTFQAISRELYRESLCHYKLSWDFVWDLMYTDLNKCVSRCDSNGERYIAIDCITPSHH